MLILHCSVGQRVPTIDISKCATIKSVGPGVACIDLVGCGSAKISNCRGNRRGVIATLDRDREGSGTTKTGGVLNGVGKTLIQRY